MNLVWFIKCIKGGRFGDDLMFFSSVPGKTSHLAQLPLKKLFSLSSVQINFTW